MCFHLSALHQVVAGVFYLFTDLILISQFIYYKIKNSSSKSKPLNYGCLKAINGACELTASCPFWQIKSLTA